MKFENPFKHLSLSEFFIWLGSVSAVLISFLFSPDKVYLTLTASLTGVTALIFLAKGDVIGQILIVVFSLLYALISYRFRYYGEMITYLAMTAPIAVISVVTWLQNPYDKENSEVRVARLRKRTIAALFLLTPLVTFIFYFILKYFNTQTLYISTLSIATSFLAASLTMLRSPYYALAYAANDIVLIALWIIAALCNISYLPMIICFIVFLINDFYGFISWQKMKKRQNSY